MDIAALSIISHHAQVKQQASLSVMKMVMDSSTQQTQSMLETVAETTKALELSVNPQFGNNLDISV